MATVRSEYIGLADKEQNWLNARMTKAVEWGLTDAELKERFGLESWTIRRAVREMAAKKRNSL